MANGVYERDDEMQDADSIGSPASSSSSSTSSTPSFYNRGAPGSESKRFSSPWSTNTGGLGRAALRNKEANPETGSGRLPEGSNTGGLKSNQSPTYGSKTEDKAEKDNTLGNGYTDEPGDRTRKKRRLRFSTRAKAGAGIGATVVIGASISFFSINTGPLELVHIAQLMEKFHLTNQEDASDGRMGKIYRYMKKGNDPGQTRLTYLESKYNDRLIKQMNDKGFIPDFDSRTGELKGFTVDPTKEQSPYFGQSPEEVHNSLNSQGIPTESRNGKIYSEAKGYRNQTKASKFFISQLHKSRVNNALRVRNFKKYGWVSWHPLVKIDKKLNESAANQYKNWKEKREKWYKKGTGSYEVKATGAVEEDDKGNKTPIGDASGSPDSGKVSDTLNQIKNSKSLRITGGLAAATGVVCAAKTVGDNIGQVRYAQVIQPLMRMGTDAITVGGQAMSGELDATTAGFVARSFNETKDGKTVSTWNQAASIKAEQGQSGGIDINQTTKDTISEGKPSWLAWTSSSAVGDLCGTAGQIAAGVVSVTIGVLSGGVVSTVGGAIIGSIASNQVIEKLSNLLSGKAVNVAAAGAEWGNDINFGSRMFGNAMALSSGGTKLTGSQVAALDADRNQEDREEFASRSAIARVFDVYDERSVAAKVIDETPDLRNGGIASMVRGIPLLFGKTLESPAKLLVHRAGAATTYDYGFPEIGFSKEDLGNQLVADPYKNAELTAVILNKNGQAGTPDYIARAHDCYGIDIKKDSNNVWAAFPMEGVDGVYAKIYDKTSDYDNLGCTDGGNKDWLRIRFFIFDSGLMDGWACFEKDADSCAAVGADADTGADDSSDSDSAPAVDGSTQDLAQQILDLAQKKHKIKIDDYSTDKAADHATHSLASQQLADIAAGKEASLSTRCSYSLPKTVKPDKRMLQFLADLGDQTSYTISVLFGQCHTSAGSNHHQGKAVDFGCPLNTAVADRVGKKYGISHNDESCGGPTNHWHYSVGGK